MFPINLDVTSPLAAYGALKFSIRPLSVREKAVAVLAVNYADLSIQVIKDQAIQWFLGNTVSHGLTIDDVCTAIDLNKDEAIQNAKSAFDAPCYVSPQVKSTRTKKVSVDFSSQDSLF